MPTPEQRGQIITLHKQSKLSVKQIRRITRCTDEEIIAVLTEEGIYRPAKPVPEPRRGRRWDPPTALSKINKPNVLHLAMPHVPGFDPGTMTRLKDGKRVPTNIQEVMFIANSALKQKGEQQISQNPAWMV